MLDLKLIRANPKEIAENCRRRNVDVDIEKLLMIDEKVRSVTTKIDSIREKRNDISSKMKSKISKIERQPLIEDSKTLREEENLKEVELRRLVKERLILLKQIPNLTHPDVPDGISDEDNKLIKKIGIKRDFDFKPRDHVELMENLDLIDFDGGSKVSGQKFYYLKNEQIERSHIVVNNFFLGHFRFKFEL